MEVAQHPNAKYTSRQTKATGLAALSAFLAVFLIVPACSCACGHMEATGLALSSPMAIIAWLAFIFGGKTHLVWSFVRMIAAVLTTVVLVKNVADVLWFGHGPVFDKIPAVFGG